MNPRQLVPAPAIPWVEVAVGAGRGRGDRSLLPRPRLGERLERSDGGLSVLAAPAGYGKTVAVEQWLGTLGGRPVTYVRHQPGSDAGGSDLPDLCAGLEGVLVVDGVDTADDAPTRRRLLEVVASAGPTLQIVLTGRHRWLTDLRRSPEVPTDVIDGSVLAFDAEEVGDVVRRIAEVELTDAQRRELLERTAGWPVAVQMVALAIRTTRDPDDVLRHFGREDRHLVSYFEAEVIGHEREAVRRFLHRCSVLDALHPALCEEAMGVVGAGALLEELTARSAFVERLPGSEPWYALHPLMRTVLRAGLKGSPGVEDAILAGAARWYRGRAEPERAGRLLVASQRWDEVLQLLDEDGARLYERGFADEVVGWLGSIPTPAGADRYGVALRKAAFLTMAGHTQRAADALHVFEAPGATDGELAVAHVIRAASAFFDASPSAAIASGGDALRALERSVVSETEIPDVVGLGTRANVELLARAGRARARWFQGEVDDARDELRDLLGSTESEAAFRWRAVGTLALLEAWAGHLAEAEAIAEESLRGAHTAVADDHPAAVDARLALAHVHRQRGHLERAGRELDAVDVILDRVRSPSAAAVRDVGRARLSLATGDFQAGLATLDRHRSAARLAPLPTVDDHLRAVEAQLHLSVGAVERAAALVDAAPRPLLPMTAAAAVQVALAQHDRDAVTARLADLAAASDGGPAATTAHELLALVAEAAGGDRAAAMERAEPVVGEVLARGDERSLLDLGRPAHDLLRALHRRRPRAELDVLLRRHRGLAFGLSERELEIIRYLPTPLPNGQIAERLFISLNTLKTHLASIYRKLGVGDRQEAVDRASTLGLI